MSIIALAGLVLSLPPCLSMALVILGARCFVQANLSTCCIHRRSGQLIIDYVPRLARSYYVYQGNDGLSVMDASVIRLLTSCLKSCLLNLSSLITFRRFGRQAQQPRIK